MTGLEHGCNSVPVLSALRSNLYFYFTCVRFMLEIMQAKQQNKYVSISKLSGWFLSDFPNNLHASYNPTIQYNSRSFQLLPSSSQYLKPQSWDVETCDIYIYTRRTTASRPLLALRGSLCIYALCIFPIYNYNNIIHFIITSLTTCKCRIFRLGIWRFGDLYIFLV